MNRRRLESSLVQCARTALLLASMACGADNVSGSNASIAGTYTLEQVNSTALPYTLSQTATTKYEVLDDSYTLNIDGTFSEIGHYRTTNGAQVTMQTVSDAGKYLYQNGFISLQSLINTGGAINAQIVEKAMILPTTGVTLVYRRP